VKPNVNFPERNGNRLRCEKKEEKGKADCLDILLFPQFCGAGLFFCFLEFIGGKTLLSECGKN
jgi:hypothetical protein